MLGIQHTVNRIMSVQSKELYRTGSLGSPRKERRRSLKCAEGDGDVTGRFSCQLNILLSVAHILAVPFYIRDHNGTESKAI
jgi:hypothetical protein